MKKPMYYGIDISETGKHISYIRKSHGLTVKDVQEYMGFSSVGSIYKWERGESIPAIESLKTLSVLYNMHIEDIIIWIDLPQE